MDKNVFMSVCWLPCHRLIRQHHHQFLPLMINGDNVSTSIKQRPGWLHGNTLPDIRPNRCYSKKPLVK